GNASRATSLAFMDRVDPGDVFRPLRRLDVEIDDHGFIVGAHQHAFEHLVATGIDLLVRHVRRHVDEIAGPRFGDEFEMLAPAHARLSAQHVDHALERAVMMRAGLGIRMDMDGAGPDLLRTDAGVVDRRLAVHPGRLRGVGVERIAGDDPHAVMLPFRLVLVAHGLPHCPRLAALANLRASSAARNSALALLMHSCCSVSGSLSATMPAPACTYILPSLISAVRKTMQVYISPAAEKYPTAPA